MARSSRRFWHVYFDNFDVMEVFDPAEALVAATSKNNPQAIRARDAYNFFKCPRTEAKAETQSPLGTALGCEVDGVKVQCDRRLSSCDG